MAWPSTRLTELLEIRLPIVQAPMAGGPTTPELVAAVSEAGALGSIGAATLQAEAVETEMTLQMRDAQAGNVTYLARLDGV